MSALLQDVWQDLRAKRLWPVAVLLALALVAVPVLMVRPAAEPPPAPGAPSAKRSAAVDVSADPIAGSSGLGTFAAKDPFRPRGDAPAGQNDQPAQDGDAPAAGEPAAGSAPTPPTGGGDEPPTAAGIGAGTATPSPGSGTPSGGAPAVTRYTSTVDIRFGRRGSERTLKGVYRLTLLPSKKRPLLVFLGVTPQGDEAVFLVDGQLGQTGEGACRPSRNNCSFLYLKTDDDRDEHSFADEQGREYELRLLKIGRREIKRPKASASTGRPAPKAARAARGWFFGLPVFGDERHRR